jgi:hypothetical protein
MVSHPIGTTVKAMNFFHSIPVRKQKAEKDAPKVIQSIRKLLHAYVLSRPNVRLSFKVLKAKTTKSNFTYTPKSGGGSVEDAVMKIYGKDCANQCSAVVQHLEGFEFHAFLPRMGCEPIKINGTGQHLSIDSRPVSTARGSLKEVAALFRTTLKKHDSTFENVKDPILVLNIVCPPGSYDPNVEPLKDDVLFSDKATLIASAERFFQLRYPHKPPELTQLRARDSSPALSSISPVIEGHRPSLITCTQYNGHLVNIMASPERNEINEASIPELPTLGRESQTNQPPSSASTIQSSLAEDKMLFDQSTDSQQWKENMHDYDEEDCSGYTGLEECPPSCGADELGKVNRDISLSNPWTFTKVHAPVRSTTAALSVGAGMRENQLTPSSTLQRSSGFTPINIPHMSQVPFGDSGNEIRYHRQLLTPFSSSSSGGTNLVDIPEASTRRPLPRSRSVMKPRRLVQGNSTQHDASRYPARFAPRQQYSGGNCDIRHFIGGGSTKKKQPRNEADDHGLVPQGQPEEPIIEMDAEAPRQIPSMRTQSSLLGTSDGLTRRDTGLERQGVAAVDPAIIQFFTNPEQPQKRRQTAAGPHRTRSTILPLNHIPNNALMQNVVQTITISSCAIAESLWKLDLTANSLLWERADEGAYRKDIAPLCELMESEWSSQLGDLLRLKYPDEAPVEYLDSQLQLALKAVKELSFD